MSNRIIALIDMDCFYCQVECKINPSLCGKPLAVVQYNTWKGGGIIAVNYEARNKGVSRHMRGDEAKQHCPEIELCRVPCVRGKADISKYRNAGREVIAVLSEFSNIVERASIDEAYIDLTDVVQDRMKTIGRVELQQLSNTFVVGYGPDNNDEDARCVGVSEWLSQVYSDTDASMINIEDFLDLTVAGVIVEEIRAAVLSKTQFHCSAGVAHNKVLAKLVCGLHKPQKQSILPNCSIPMLYSSLPIKKVRHLGGKLGDEVVEKFQCTTMLELEKFSLKHIQAHFDEKTASWLYNIVRGIDSEPVNARLVSKSVGCCKRFPGKTCLASRSDVSHWIQELTDEICERLEDDWTLNKRRAQLLTVSFTQEIDGRTISCSRSMALPSYKLQDIVDVSQQVINKTNTAPASSDVWSPPLLFLGLSASKFAASGSHQSIQQFFKPVETIDPSSTFPSFSTSSVNEDKNQNLQDEAPVSKPETVHFYFNKLSPWQLELSRVEKKLNVRFASYIDSQVKSCTNFDRLVLTDIAMDIKTNTTERLKAHLKGEHGDLEKIEENVAEKLKEDIDKALRDIGVLCDMSGRDKSEGDLHRMDACLNKHGLKSDESSKVPIQIKTELSLYSSNLTNDEKRPNADPSVAKKLRKDYNDAMESNSPNGKKQNPGVFDSFKSVSQHAVVSDERLKMDADNRDVNTYTRRQRNTEVEDSNDIVTYTRRQINPAQISDVLSDSESPSPQIISKPIAAISTQKYETVEKKCSDKKSQLPIFFKNAKKSCNTSVEESPQKKRYSFFETYLRRKKEKERLSMMSKSDDQTSGQSEEARHHQNNDSMDCNGVAQESKQSENDFPINSKEKRFETETSDNEGHPILNEPSLPKIGVDNCDSDVENDSTHFPYSTTLDIFPFVDICDDSRKIAGENDTMNNIANGSSNIAGENDTINNIANGSSEMNQDDFPSHVNSDDSSKIMCDKCNLAIAMNELLEHQDYHFALDLSNSISPRPVQNHTRANPSSNNKTLKKSGKRGRPSKLKSFKNSDSFKKLKTLDSFFKPGNSSLN